MLSVSCPLTTPLDSATALLARPDVRFDSSPKGKTRDLLRKRVWKICPWLILINYDGLDPPGPRSAVEDGSGITVTFGEDGRGNGIRTHGRL